LVEGQKPHVKEYVSKIRTQSELSLDAPRLAGFIFYSFVTGLKEVANEFGLSHGARRRGEFSTLKSRKWCMVSI
jgi:hypothetical protein